MLVPLLGVLLSMVSCKPSIPSDYLQPDELEDVLYDMHVAQGIVRTADRDATVNERDIDAYAYTDAVLKKHGVSRADFDSTMVYYYRHTELMKKLYENLSKRLSDDAMAMGATTSETNEYMTAGASGDTANIWRGERATLLVPSVPYNRLTFHITDDSLFRKGDKLLLSFDANFVYQDGSKDGVAMMAIKFDNDSVANRVIHMSSSTSYVIQMTDQLNAGIKEVRGFIYLGNNDPQTTTLKLLFLDRLQLIRMHEKEKKDSLTTQDARTIHKADSNETKTLKDSLPPNHGGLRKDSIRPLSDRPEPLRKAGG